MAPSLRNSYSTNHLTTRSRSRLFGFARDRDSKQGFGNSNRDSALLTSLDPFDAPIELPSSSMVANNVKLPRPMLRSHSTSSVHTRGSSMSQAAGRLGQGAQVVRTPQDAMSSMAQPESLDGLISRQSSLRAAGSRRPSAPPAPSSSYRTMTPPRPSSPPGERIPSPPRCSPVPLETPVESGLESSFDNLELLDNSRPSSRQLAPSSRHELHGAHSSSSLSVARHGHQGSLASQPSYSSLASQHIHNAPSRSRAGSITAVTTAGVTAGVSRSPTRASPTFQEVVDVDAAYLQRRTQRMSTTTLTPSAHSSVSSAPSTPSMSSSRTASTAGGVDILTPLGNGPRSGMGAGDSHQLQYQDDLYSSEPHLADGLGELPVLSTNGSSSRHSHQHYPSPSLSRPSGRGSPGKRPSHAGSMSVSSISSVAPFMRDAPTAAAPFAPILVSHTTRPATGSNTSSVLVTLRFGFSLDAEPNTHDVTVTYDTLKPAGGRLMTFLDSALRPSSVESSGSTLCTSAEGPDMTTEGSTDEDSDFEYDDERVHPMLDDEYLASLAGGPSMQQKEVRVNVVPATPMAHPQEHHPQPIRRRLPGQAFHHDGTGGGLFASVGALPALSELPAALAHARAGTSTGGHPAPASTLYTAPLSVTPRARSNTCPGLARGMVSELTVLLPRDAGSWHAVASRLCAGSWPELAAAKRRRVEDECRWAGMEELVGELRAMGNAQAQAQAGRGGFV